MTLFGWWEPLSVLHLLPSRISVHACLYASQFPRAKPERQALWSYSRVSVCIIHGVIPSTKARHMARPQVSEWEGLQRAWTRGSFHTLGPQLQQSAVIPTLSQEDSGELADGQRGKKAQNSMKAGEVGGDDMSFSFALFLLSPIFSPDPHGSAVLLIGRR